MGTKNRKQQSTSNSSQNEQQWRDRVERTLEMLAQSAKKPPTPEQIERRKRRLEYERRYRQALSPEQRERRRTQKRNYQRRYIADGRHRQAQERYRHTENGWLYNWEWTRKKR